MAVNPVIFPDYPESEDLTTYSNSLSELAWKNRIVGLTRSGFLYVDEKIPRKGHYDFPAKRLPWSEVRQVRISKFFHIAGALLGVALVFIAGCVFVAGWVKNTHTGPGVVTIPLLLGIGGGTLVIGSLRNRIIVETHSHKYKWISSPLTYRKTLSICSEAATLCRSHGVLLASHVEQDSPPADKNR
jgi:hypothetical protein